VGGEGGEGTLGHCAVRVKNAELNADVTIEMAPDARGSVQVYTAGPNDARTSAYTNAWSPIAIPEGMTEAEFDQRVLSSAVAVTRDIKGSPYLPHGQYNSNHFVYDVITAAGGKVPAAASGRFLLAPGICGGSGLSRGRNCSP
jgi:hypothetical protein